jgi:hypothetical protein
MDSLKAKLDGKVSSNSSFATKLKLKMSLEILGVLELLSGQTNQLNRLETDFKMKAEEVTSLKSELHAANALIEALNSKISELDSKFIDCDLETKLLQQENVVNETQEREEDYRILVDNLVKVTYKGIPEGSIVAMNLVTVVKKVREKIEKDIQSDDVDIFVRNQELIRYIEKYKLSLPPHISLDSEMILKIHRKYSNSEFFDRTYLDKNSTNHFLYIIFISLMLKYQQVFKTMIPKLPGLSEFWNYW